MTDNGWVSVASTKLTEDGQPILVAIVCVLVGFAISRILAHYFLRASHHVNRDGIKLDGDGIKLDGDGIKFDGDGVKLDGDGVKSGGDGVKLDGGGVKLDGDGIKLEGDGIKLEGDGIRLGDSVKQSGIEYFGRQLILPGFGIEGQKKLLSATVCVIGAGGLGSPACLYLTGSGIGTLHIVDHDKVSLSNLHRQVAHGISSLDQYKAISMANRCRDINPFIQIHAHTSMLSIDLALSLFAKSDVILDCADNVYVSYMISDVAVLTGKPVVRGSALRDEGQMTVLNLHAGRSPCFRCMHPAESDTHTSGDGCIKQQERQQEDEKGNVERVRDVLFLKDELTKRELSMYASINLIPDEDASCELSGVLGPVPGLLGVLQALETIKIIESEKKNETILDGKLLTFDYQYCGGVRVFGLKGRNRECCVCGDNSTHSLSILAQKFKEYVPKCSSNLYVNLPTDWSLSYKVFIDKHTHRDIFTQSSRSVNIDTLLIDVRSSLFFKIGHFQDSVNWPDDKLEWDLRTWLRRLNTSDLFSDDTHQMKDMTTKGDSRDMTTKGDSRDMTTKGDSRDMTTNGDSRDMTTKGDRDMTEEKDKRDMDEKLKLLDDLEEIFANVINRRRQFKVIGVICRKGNASRNATLRLRQIQKALKSLLRPLNIVDHSRWYFLESVSCCEILNISGGVCDSKSSSSLGGFSVL